MSIFLICFYRNLKQTKVKPNLKKILRNKSRIFLTLLISLILCGYAISIFDSFNIPTGMDSHSEITEEEDSTDKYSPSVSGQVSFSAATKSITYGSQDDPPFNDTNIKWDDGLVDSTTFSPGWGDIVHRDTADYGVTEYTGAFGSTDKGKWHFTSAYKDNDGKYLYLESTWGNDYPGTIRMKWGAYQDIASGSHQYVRRIRINYEVWADSAVGVLDESSNLRIKAWDNGGHSISKQIAGTPTHRYHYTGTLTITSGTVLSTVIAGGYIKYMEVSMYADEEWLTTTWINVDYVDIYYDYHQPDVDFYYELDYGSFGFTTVTQFTLWADITEYITGTDMHLWNYNTSTWDPFLTISTTGLNSKLITLDADHYFSQSNKFRVRFEKYDYHDGRTYNNYHIKIDKLYLLIPPPDPPPNVQVDQRIEHILLTWDTPFSFGVPVTQYNIYRGTVKGGPKSLIGTTATNEYNDSAVVVGPHYYYNISATSAAGESDNATEVSGKAYDAPFVEWTTPLENETIIFPKGEPVTFNFNYDWVALDDVELVIEKEALNVNHGSVWNKTSIDISSGSYIDGYINATLYGYNNSILLVSHSRQFTFVKIILEVTEVINSSTEILGKQLYLILHDPNGDKSYSSYLETTKLSFGVGSEITSSVGISLKIDHSFKLFGVEMGASVKLEAKITEEENFDFRYEVTDTTSLTSSQVEHDPDYIGPGYGDRYWGESWIYKWVLNATYRVYSNGTDRYEDPKLFYGILRDVETFASDEDAPPEWKSQNAVYNDSIPVNWLGYFMGSGGAPYNYEHEVTTTETRKKSFQINLGADFGLTFPGVETHVTVELSVKNYVEQGHTSIYKVAYEINDDDPSDYLVMGRGIDQRFGTFIFNTSSFFCETSNPLEHGTYDYLPPEINFPTIDYDTNGDLIGPTPDDSPFVEVLILEEGGMQEAVIWYTIDNWTNLEIEYLTEVPLDPGKWQGSIPAQLYNTTVLWYIEAWDMTGNNATLKDSFGDPFEYTVIAIPPEGSDPGIPGYSTIIILMSIAITTMTILFYNRKSYKTER